MEDYIPQEYKDEMQGIANGSGLPFIDICVYNIIVVWMHCCGVAAWGSATVDGKLIHARSLDYWLNIVDPVTGKYLQENGILIVRKPADGYGSVSPIPAGTAYALGGLNEKKVCIGLKTSYSNDRTQSGYPMVFRLREALDTASTTQEAIDIITSTATYGWNLIISDGDESIAYAVEQTWHELYVGTWNDPTESNSPFWEIDHVVRRTNIFINYETAAVQRNTFDPSRFPLLMMYLEKNVLGEEVWGVQAFASVPWMHYTALSKGVEEQWGNIDLEGMMDILRDVYTGKTDWRFSILKKRGLYASMDQWVACPETGDCLVSIASRDKSAYDNPVHQFNIFELLEAEPPP
jgi:hypothetical protein